METYPLFDPIVKPISNENLCHSEFTALRKLNEHLNDMVEKLQDKIGTLENELDQMHRSMEDMKLEIKSECEVELKLLKIKIDEKDEMINCLTEQLEETKKQSLTSIETPSSIEPTLHSNEDKDCLPSIALLDLPNFVKSLELELHEHPDHFLEIHRKWENLVIWRHSFLKDILHCKPNPMYMRTDIQLLEIAAVQCGPIDTLAELLCSTLWCNVRNFLDVALSQSQLLQDCISLIVTTDDCPNDEHSKIIRSCMIQLHCSGTDGLMRYESMKKRCFAELERGFKQRCQYNLSLLLKKDHQVVEIQSVVQDMVLIETLVLPWFPSSYEIGGYFKTRMSHALKDQLVEIEKQLAQLDLTVLFRIVKWLEMCKTECNKLGWHELEEPLEYTDVQLTQLVLSLLQQKLESQLDAIIYSPCTPQRTNEGFLSTNSVDSITSELLHVVYYMSENLSGNRLLEGLKLCLLVLQRRCQYEENEIESIMKQSTLTGSEMIERFCAIANDNDRLQLRMMEILRCCKSSLNSIQMDHMKKDLDDVKEEFIECSNRAIETIAQVIFQDLNSVLNGLFTIRWMSKTSSPILIALATFDDYFGDLETWFYSTISCPTLIKECIQELVKEYVERLLSPTTTGFEMKDRLVVAENLHQDGKSIENYTLKWFSNEEQHTPILKNVAILEVLARFFAFDDPSVVFPELAEEFGHSAGIALEKLIRLRLDLSLEQSKRMLLDIKEFKMWAQHAPHQRFHLISFQEEQIKTNSKMKKAQALFRKRFQASKFKRRGAAGVAEGEAREAGEGEEEHRRGSILGNKVQVLNAKRISLLQNLHSGLGGRNN